MLRKSDVKNTTVVLTEDVAEQPATKCFNLKTSQEIANSRSKWTISSMF